MDTHLTHFPATDDRPQAFTVEEANVEVRGVRIVTEHYTHEDDDRTHAAVNLFVRPDGAVAAHVHDNDGRAALRLSIGDAQVVLFVDSPNDLTRIADAITEAVAR